MTRQEAFNISYLGVIAQGRSSSDAEGCLYRGLDGCKCNIGQLLTDNEARGLDQVDGTGSVKGLFSRGRLPSRFAEDDMAFYGDLQKAHDDAYSDRMDFLVAYKSRMRALARRYALTIS